jgi:hypothetical protein
VNGRRSAAAIVAVGIAASQAGHLLAYQLRFGGAAQQIQSSGAHAYFPALAKSGIGLAAAALLTALFMVGLARVVSGRRAEVVSAPSYGRLLAALFTIQLAFFALQETVESLVAGAPPSSSAVLLLWGTLGQLPIAALSALALRWLLTRLRPAIAVLRAATAPIHLTPALVPIPPSSRPEAFVARVAPSSFSRRGPPSF